MINPAFILTAIMRIICQYCLEKLRSGLSLNIYAQVTSQVIVRCFTFEIISPGIRMTFFSFIIRLDVVLYFCHNITSVVGCFFFAARFS
jgi:hypothetical protein